MGSLAAWMLRHRLQPDIPEVHEFDLVEMMYITAGQMYHLLPTGA